MKITTYNVNGIRAAINKGMIEWLQAENPDILCLQEIKLFETEIVEHHFKNLGYYCYWYPAQKKGYSGVAILSKIPALNITYGCGVDQYDFEGRTILADFGAFQLLCAYFPSGSSGDERQSIKIQFLDDIYKYIHQIKKQNQNLIVCGDINICHTEIDIHNPKSNAKTSGFLPEERAWITKFLESGFSDGFRIINQSPHQYSWWSYRAGARGKNLGWRIDYVFVEKSMEPMVTAAHIHNDCMMSDHCPVSLEFNF